MDPLGWVSLFAVCLLGAMSPGPSLAIVIGNTLNGGRRGGARTAIAHGTGVALYGLITVSGLGLVVTQTPVLFTGLQLCGAIYLIWLGVQALRSSAADSERRHRGGNGFLIVFLNPKLAVFMLALFSQFLGPDTGVLTKAGMVATVGVTDTGWYLLVVLLVSHNTLLPRIEAHRSTIDRVFAAALLLLGVSVLARTAMVSF